VDRQLLQRCFAHEPGAWNDFVDRYLGLVYHVIHYTAYLRSTPLPPEDVEDVASEVLLQIVASDYAVLRSFRGHSSLAAYLTVISRRICVHELTRRHAHRDMHAKTGNGAADHAADDRPTASVGLEGLEEVEKLLRKLPAKDRQVVRMFYLEGRTYEEISTELNIPVNTIGPVLSRARKRLREDSGEHRTAARPAKAGKKTPPASA